MIRLASILSILLIFTQCTAQSKVKTGAENMGQYLPLLAAKKVGMVVNQTSTVGHTHLVDTLLSKNINIIKVFAPEHGFRGTADAGESIKDAKDPKTGLPIISLYGKNKKPSPEQLHDIDLLIFDIQDVGARFLYIYQYHALYHGSCR